MNRYSICGCNHSTILQVSQILGFSMFILCFHLLPWAARTRRLGILVLTGLTCVFAGGFVWCLPPKYVTRHLLAMPIIDFEGSCLGVIQAINKHHGGRGRTTAFRWEGRLRQAATRGGWGHGFEPADEIMLNTLAEQVSVALHNAEFYRAAIITSERANAAWQVSRKRTKWPVICIHQWCGVIRVLCLLNWGLTKHDAIIDAWPRRSIADFVGSGLRISPKRILQVQLEVLKNGQICC